MSGGLHFLLDTHVISETRKTRADDSVMAFIAAIDASNLFISALAIGELRKGVEIRRQRTPMPR